MLLCKKMCNKRRRKEWRSMDHHLTLMFFRILSFVAAASSSEYCRGTDNGLMTRETHVQYMQLKKDYENCTRVRGNLEITGLTRYDRDTYFLENIVEVTGYVLIAMNEVPYLKLHNLRIIRGETLYENQFALYLFMNEENQLEPEHGLQELRLSALTEIVRGNVSFQNNSLLCFVDTINWTDIFNAKRKRNFANHVANHDGPPLRTCGSCHESCAHGCWGSGPDMCQTLTSTICSDDCGKARCRGSSNSDCCDDECASGCTGPHANQCFDCLNYNNTATGNCVSFCPPRRNIQPGKEVAVENPDGMFVYHNQCVKKCPSNKLVEGDICVTTCRKEYRENGQRECVPCDQECQERASTCKGITDEEKTVRSNNIERFRNCSEVTGNIIFNTHAFLNDTEEGVRALTAKDLEAFKDVRIISGYLWIQDWPETLHNFSMFSNLQLIKGVNLYGDKVALLIHDLPADKRRPDVAPHLQHITALGFQSLKSIEHGNVYIRHLDNLCYGEQINWVRIIKNPKTNDTKNYPNGLRWGLNCVNKAWKQCSPHCKDGCWAAGATQCVSCKDHVYNNECMPECALDRGIYAPNGSDRCRECDEMCEFSCYGPGPTNCTSCRFVQDGDSCVAACPADKYRDAATRTCKECHEFCKLGDGDRNRCSGPNVTLGEGGCSDCFKELTSDDSSPQPSRCLQPSPDICPRGYFFQKIIRENRPNKCIPCATGCANCIGRSDEDCIEWMGGMQNSVLIIVVIVVIAAFSIAVGKWMFRRRRDQNRRKHARSMRGLGIDPGGCSDCFKELTSDNSSPQPSRCLQPSPDISPRGYFFQKSIRENRPNKCIPCATGCANCTGQSDEDCIERMG